MSLRVTRLGSCLSKCHGRNLGRSRCSLGMCLCARPHPRAAVETLSPSHPKAARAARPHPRVAVETGHPRIRAQPGPLDRILVPPSRLWSPPHPCAARAARPHPRAAVETLSPPHPCAARAARPHPRAAVETLSPPHPCAARAARPCPRHRLRDFGGKASRRR